MAEDQDVVVADTVVKEICRIAAAALIGAAVGAALGLLFAPKPGTELRGELKSKAEDLAAQMREKARRHTGEELLEAAEEAEA
jgi:gas vesicle protein